MNDSHTGVPFNQPPPGPGAVQPRRPYPQFNNLTACVTNGSGSYHSLQARVEKRFSRNLGILTSYTWSRTLDDTKAILIGTGLENLDFALFKNFAIRERFALQFRWELFNSLNHANFGFPSATINVPATAGQIFSAASGTQMQFGLKFTF